MHAPPDADVGERVHPVPAIGELRLSQPLLARPHPAAPGVAFRNRTGDGAVRGGVGLGGLLLSRRRGVRREFATGGKPDDQLVHPRHQEALHLENGRHEGVGGFAHELAVDEDLSVKVETIEHQLLALVSEELHARFEVGPVPPGSGLRPAALRHVGAHGRFGHLSGAHEIQVDLSRNLRRHPPPGGLLYPGKPVRPDAFHRVRSRRPEPVQ